MGGLETFPLGMRAKTVVSFDSGVALYLFKLLCLSTDISHESTTFYVLLLGRDC